MQARIALIPLLVACKATSSLGYLAPPAGDDGRLGLGHLDVHVAKALVSEYGKQVHAVAPMSLVPSDGQALELRALAAAVTIEGPLAHTELHFTFHNAEHRNREGRFMITLPAGAAVGRFAMKNGTEWREARVVSRMQGRQVYEQTLKRRIDPALLEQDLGNQFSARVFPITADADKEIIIAYDHEVSALRPYTLALGGLPAIPQLTIAVDQDGEKRALARGTGDVIVPIAAGTAAVAGDGAFVARLESSAQLAPAALDHVMFLVDTSASRATVMGRQALLLRALIAALPPETAVVVAAFDHDLDELYRGSAHDAAGVEDALLEHDALGGSDLGAALARVAAAGMERLVIIGDGAPTLGEADPGKLAAIVHASPIDRVDAVQLGQSIDRETLALVVAAGKHAGAILDGEDPARVAHQLASALAPEQPIHVAGATATWPATTRGVAPGEPVWVFGLRSGPEPLSIELGETAIVVPARAIDATHAHRAVASAQLVALTEALDRAPADGKVAIAKQIEEVALANKLVSSQTSLLVLESDADEDRQLGPRPIDTQPPVEASQPTFDEKTGMHEQGGEVILIRSTAPTIDPTSTSQGIVIDKNYLRNIPVPGRTFEQALGSVAGLNQADDGIMTGSFSGASSLESQYYVDGVSTGQPASSPRDEPAGPAPYSGNFQKVMQAIHDRHPPLELATRMHLENPGDIVALVALGEALEARGAHTLAARAYGSLLDLFPSRADLLRAAGERLDRLPGARKLAIDAYRRAIKERPDQVSTYRLLAYDLLRDGHDREALDTLAAGLPHAARESVKRILREDLGLIGAHLVAGHPSERAYVTKLAGAKLPTTRSFRVVLSWETDANDVDLHVRDSLGGHSFYGAMALPSGGTLLDDITDGFGPEMFSVDKPGAFPYHVSAKYFRMGPMGFGMGSVQVIKFDGAGTIEVEDRPFLIQTDLATVELGTITE